MIHPYIKHILVRRDPANTEEKTEGGIIVPHEQKRREENQVVMRWGTIVEVGAEVETLKTGWRLGYNPFDAVEHYDPKTDTIYDVVAAIGVRSYVKA